MTARRLIIVGAGGFGREVLDVLRAHDPYEERWKFAGFAAADEPSHEILDRLGASWLGTIEDALDKVPSAAYSIGIGNPRVRARIAAQLDARGFEAVTLVHPSSTLGADVELAPGVVICSHVSITTNVRLGAHTHINLNSTIGHDCRVESFVTVNPLSAVSGDVVLREGATLGTTSAILQGLSVGEFAIVGAGAVVVRDVAPGATVVGVPAKPIAKS